MSKISLRAYNREIETMIERGHSEEAIAHCKYILKTYSKHLDTYRLLGKAFLESQRYGEAADILNRILSVIPDDFVAQIGMSIIREDEGNLDAAIFHMEKSFEIQPSNAAIQDELRRLYGRRDGIEPPKLRLTRGALVRMYARGDLYRQAIAEARAAIKEDPQRLDLEIVLALMYYQTGQKAEAAEICSRLVMKLPYCMEANRILADVLPETSRSDDAKIYKQRLEALEPYLAYQSDSSQSISQIPDNAVTLDRLEWIPSLETAQQPAWANNLGLEIDEKEDVQTPEWLSALSDEPESSIGEDSTSKPFVQQPESSQSSDNSLQTSYDQLLGTTAADQVTQAEADADLPDWMKDLSEPSAAAGEEKLPDWMQGMGETLAATDEENQLDSTLGVVETPAAAAEEKLPDWMQDIRETPAAPDEDKLPDWMQSSGWEISENPAETQAETQASSAVFEETEEAIAAPADIPDWLKDLAPASQDDQAAETPASPVEIPAAEDTLNSSSKTGIDDDLPEWLKSPPSSYEENTNVQSQEPLPDWLTESSESLHAQVNEPTALENVVEEAPSVAETQPTAVQPDNELTIGSPDTQVSAVADETTLEAAPNLDNMDDAMAWLESLAAKQGADEETLLTKPEDRLDTPPDWVAQASIASETPVADHEEVVPTSITAEPQAVLEEPVSPTLPVTAELTSLDQGDELTTVSEVSPVAATNEESEPVAEEVIQPTQIEEQPIVSDIPAAAGEVGLVEPEAEAASTTSDEPDQADLDSAFAWLKSLAAKQGAEPDTLLVSSEERLENPPDWIQQESAEAVSESKHETVEPPMEAVEAASEALPDWMSQSEPVETPAVEMPPVEEPLPDWLQEINQPQDTVEDAALPPAGDISFTTEEEMVSTESPVNEEIATDWVKETDMPETEEPVEQFTAGPTAEVKQESPEPEPLTETNEPAPLPDWLSNDLSKPSADLEAAPSQESEIPDLPDWLQAEKTVDEFAPSDLASDAGEGQTPPLPDWLKDLEAEHEEEPLPIEGSFNLAPAETQEPGEMSELPDEMILQAQNALGKGQIDFALSAYQHLIDHDQKLDETIHDLRDALYRFPVDSVIWQTLGDAYMRNNQVQDALDAFTKAEELLK